MVAVNSFRVSGLALSWDDLNSVGLDKWPIVCVLLLKIRLSAISDTDLFFALVSVNH